MNTTSPTSTGKSRASTTARWRLQLRCEQSGPEWTGKLPEPRNAHAADCCAERFLQQHRVDAGVAVGGCRGNRLLRRPPHEPQQLVLRAVEEGVEQLPDRLPPHFFAVGGRGVYEGSSHLAPFELALFEQA